MRVLYGGIHNLGIWYRNHFSGCIFDFWNSCIPNNLCMQDKDRFYDDGWYVLRYGF